MSFHLCRGIELEIHSECLVAHLNNIYIVLISDRKKTFILLCYYFYFFIQPPQYTHVYDGWVFISGYSNEFFLNLELFL